MDAGIGKDKPASCIHAPGPQRGLSSEPIPASSIAANRVAFMAEVASAIARCLERAPRR